MRPPRWGDLPSDVLALVLDALPQQSRLAVVATCKGWRALAARSETWGQLEFATQRHGTRRSELRRILSLATWAKRHAAAVRSFTISARLPPDCQAIAMKAVSQAVLAAAGTLQLLSLTTNRGHWPGPWLSCLTNLRCLHLASVDGGLSLHGNLAPLVHLKCLVLSAKQAVTLQEHVRLPPNVLRCELSCIRDTLPLPLSQLTSLRCLTVRQALISEGLLLAEYDVLASLTGLTSLSLEYQGEGEVAWLPPAELLSLPLLRHLSIQGNDCSRWPLHGGDGEFDLMLTSMAQLTSLSIADCGMDTLPGALLTAGGPRLLRLLAHGNQLEAGEGEVEEGDQHGPALVFPSTVRQLSIDFQLLNLLQPHTTARAQQQPPAIVLPAHCRELALLGRESVQPDLLVQLLQQLPELQRLVLEQPALDALWCSSGGGGCDDSRGDWRRVGGYWRPTRLPGQPRPRRRKPDMQQVLLEAGVEVVEWSKASWL